VDNLWLETKIDTEKITNKKEAIDWTRRMHAILSYPANTP
jgi:hypothetical protein